TSFTTSLTSSITNYRYENGRRYHGFRDAEGYFLPNDELENDRLDLFHHILTLRCDGNLHFAPIGPNPNRILDLGTGTGIWAIDMGDEYPSAEVLGNDLSPIQPAMVPPNVRFEVDDMENEWVYSSKFDFIHARYLAGAIKDWPKPGGWVEFHDFDMQFYTLKGEFTRGCPSDEWTSQIVQGLKKAGMEPEPGPKLKEIGALDYHQFIEGLEAISLHILTNALGWKPEEVQVFLIDVRKDLKNPRLQAQHNFHAVYAQKPLDEKE
ncbi:uncharacterized protein TRUGW13939_04751, partial [Talaromyces rugulosus]